MTKAYRSAGFYYFAKEDLLICASTVIDGALIDPGSDLPLDGIVVELNPAQKAMSLSILSGAKMVLWIF
jgi:hypothetical protein